MKQIIKSIVLFAALLPTLAVAQVTNYPQTLPPNTVVGRLGVGPGPSQAIPIATVISKGATANANTVLAGPASGVSAGATFRSLIGADLPLPTTSSLGGIQAIAPISHQWLNSISASGVPQLSQPACADISNAAASCAIDTTQANNITGGTLPAARLPQIANAHLLANATGSTTNAQDTTLSALFGLACASSVGQAWIQLTGGWGCTSLGQLNAKWFGATGNGSTDDTTALQNWINACQTSGVVCFLDGSSNCYVTSSTLNVTSALQIAGMGTIPIASGGRGSVLCPATTISGIAVSTQQAVYFHDFSVNYASAAAASASAIIVTASGPTASNYGSRFERVSIFNAGHGFNFGLAQDFSMSNCWIENAVTDGVVLNNTGLTNIDVGDSTITGTSFILPGAANAIVVPSFAGLRVVNNKIIGDFSTASQGILLTLPTGINPSLLMIIGNSIEGKNGITLQRAGSTGTFTNVVIANNEFEPLAGGWAVNNPTDVNGAWLKTISITGNIIFGPGTSTSTFGYIVKAASGVQIGNNLTTSNSTTNGFTILATTGSNNCTLGPNGHGPGLFVTSDTGCTTVATIAPN